jgi:hypothetical protein
VALQAVVLLELLYSSMKVLETFNYFDNPECTGKSVESGTIVILLLIILIHALYKLWEFSAGPIYVSSHCVYFHSLSVSSHFVH